MYWLNKIYDKPISFSVFPFPHITTKFHEHHIQSITSFASFLLKVHESIKDLYFKKKALSY